MATRELIDTTTSAVFSVSRYTDLNDAVTAIGATEAILLIDASTATDGNVTIPATTTVIFINGGDITGTDTVTFAGNVIDERSSSGSAKSVAIVPDNITEFPHIGQWVNMKRGRVLTAYEFGAKGDGSTDDSTSIQTMMDADRDRGSGMVHFEPGQYRCVNVRVFSGTTVKGPGYLYPFTLDSSAPWIKSVAHAGTQAIFYAEPGGDDPQASVVRNINFTDMLLINGDGTYDASPTKGIWLKTDSQHCLFERLSMTDFTRQGIHTEYTSTAAQIHKFTHMHILACYAVENTLSDYIGAIDIEGGECHIHDVDVFSGSNQDYATYPSDLFRCAIKVDQNEHWMSNVIAQFGDHAALIRATKTRMVNCRADNAGGHGFFFIQESGQNPPRRLQVTNCHAFRNGAHADDTFDGFHIEDGDSIGNCNFRGCTAESVTSDSYAHRYGFYDGGPTIGAVDWETTPNRFDDQCWSINHATLDFGGASNTNPHSVGLNKFVNLEQNSTTPTVRNLQNAKTNNTSSTVYTNFLGGVEGQELFLVISDNNSDFDFTGTNLKGNGGADWTTAASGDHLFARYDGTNWYCTIHDNTP